MNKTLSVGTDLVEITRVAAVLQRHPVRFLTRHFTPAEQAECAGAAARLAARWAGKEAAAKALGTGVGPVGWHELEITCDGAGAPRLQLHGSAGRRAKDLGLATWSVSLSHTAGHAVAVVVATA